MNARPSAARTTASHPAPTNRRPPSLAPEPPPTRWSHFLGAAAFRSASWLLSALPRSVTVDGARALGRAFYYLRRTRRQVALENARIALAQELDEDARRRLARASFGSAAAMAADLFTLPRVARDPRAHCDVSEESLKALRDAQARGRGVLLLAGHFGLFESMGILLGHEGFRVHFVAKPLGNPALDRAVNANRSLTGNDFIHKGGAKDRIREVLAAGDCVAIVVDQHVGRRDRLWVPFFGVPAATTRSLGTLALETGAPVVPIHSFPVAGGRCRCEFGPAVEAPDPDAPGAAEDLAHRCIQEMEAATRRQLEAWLWLHRRWKVRPDGPQGPYPSYAMTESDEDELVKARLAQLAAQRRTLG